MGTSNERDHDDLSRVCTARPALARVAGLLHPQLPQHPRRQDQPPTDRHRDRGHHALRSGCGPRVHLGDHDGAARRLFRSEAGARRSWRPRPRAADHRQAGGQDLRLHQADAAADGAQDRQAGEQGGATRRCRNLRPSAVVGVCRSCGGG